MRTPYFQALLAALILAAPATQAREALHRPAPAVAGVIRVASPEAAISLALQHSPGLRAAQAAVDASRGDLLQAGLRPNPGIGLSGENVAGSGTYRSGQSLESTLEVSQPLEIGGQRAARVRVARAELALARRDLAAVQLDLIRDVRRAYAEAVAARRAQAIEADRVRLVEEVLHAAQERVRAGREPLLQERRAEAALSIATIAHQRAERRAGVRLQALASLLGADAVDLGRSDRWFDDIGPTPIDVVDGAAPTNTLDLEENPDFARWSDVIVRQRAALDLERRRSIPDVTIGAGVRRYSETSDTALMLGVSVPLPLFNRNQGAIMRSGAEVTQAEFTADQTRRVISTALAQAHQELTVAWREADGLRRTVLPAAEEAFGYAREGYREGKFSFLEVLDAQRTLFEARGQLNDALREVHAGRAEADRLAGGPMIGPKPLTEGGQS